MLVQHSCSADLVLGTVMSNPTRIRWKPVGSFSNEGTSKWEWKSIFCTVLLGWGELKQRHSRLWLSFFTGSVPKSYIRSRGDIIFQVLYKQPRLVYYLIFPERTPAYKKTSFIFCCHKPKAYDCVMQENSPLMMSSSSLSRRLADTWVFKVSSCLCVKGCF